MKLEKLLVIMYKLLYVWYNMRTNVVLV